MSSDIAIRVKGLGKCYRLYRTEGARVRDLMFRSAKGADRWVLRDVSFDLMRGESLGVVGRNGAGKSTLLKIIAGTLTPSTGTAEVNGRVATLLELGAGLHRDYTGRENARFSARVMGLNAGDFDAVSDEIERFADLGDFYDRRISEYSSGMYARLAFAINIHLRPDILIVDEILSVGDIGFQLKCLEFLRGYCEGGGTLLFVSHDDAAVRALCDRAIWLDDGVLADDGPAQRVLRRYHSATMRRRSSTVPFEVVDADPPDPVAPAEPAGQQTAPGFDPRTLPERPDQGQIDEITLFDSRGHQLAMAHGGHRIDLCIRFHCAAALDRASVCFVLRNRMAQWLFGSRTKAALAIAAGAGAEARFSFVLPYVPSGEYVIEALVLDGADGDEAIVQRQTLVIPVHTVHISHGLANVRMKDVLIEHGPLPDPAMHEA